MILMAMIKIMVAKEMIVMMRTTSPPWLQVPLEDCQLASPAKEDFSVTRMKTLKW